VCQFFRNCTTYIILSNIITGPILEGQVIDTIPVWKEFARRAKLARKLPSFLAKLANLQRFLQVGCNELCLRAQRGSFGEILKALSGPGHAVDVVTDIREGESSPRRSSLTIQIIAEMKREQRGSSGIPRACKSRRKKRADCCLFEANNTRLVGILA